MFKVGQKFLGKYPNYTRWYGTIIIEVSEHSLVFERARDGKIVRMDKYKIIETLERGILKPDFESTFKDKYL